MGSAFLGLEVFDPVAAERLKAEERLEQFAQPEIAVLVESDRTLAADESGNTPIADLPSQPQIELFRFENAAPELTQPELPDRQPDEMESLNTQVTDVSQFEERSEIEFARPEDAGMEGPKRVAAEDPATDLKSVFEQNDADVPEVQKSRQRSNPGVDSDTVRPEVAQTPSQRPREFSLEQNQTDVSLNPLPTETDMPLLRPAEETDLDQIQNKSAPQIATLPSDLEGTGSSISVPTPSASTTFQPRLPRQSRGRFRQ